MAVRKRIWLNSPYHNYTDRKKYKLTEAEIAQYTLYSEDNTHWNYGDFVSSSCITICSIDIFTVQPNYMILMNGNTIESRWYVNGYQFISGEPNDKSKFQAYLLRDVVVDTSLSSYSFKCRRGMLPRNQWSPALIQPEGLITNSVKKAQKSIQSWDKDTQWLTIFYDVTAGTPEKPINRTIEWAVPYDANYTFAVMKNEFAEKHFTPALAWTGSTYRLSRTWQNLRMKVNIALQQSGALPNITGTLTAWINVNNPSDSVTIDTWDWSGVSNANEAEKDIIEDKIRAQLLSYDYMFAKASGNFSINQSYDTEYSALRNKYSGQVVSQDSVYKRVNFGLPAAYSALVTNQIVNETLADIVLQVSQFSFSVNAGQWQTTATATITASGNYAHQASIHDFEVTLTVVPSSAKLVLPVTAQLDEIYLGCVTIPFGPNTSILHSGFNFKLDANAIKSIITSGRTASNTAIKDIQILPYCPSGRLNSLNTGNAEASNVISTAGVKAEEQIGITTTTSTPDDTIIYWAFTCTQSSMDYRFPVDVSDWFGTDLKMDSMTKKVRLVAHNHKAIFEFNPALNNGFLWMSFSCTIRPFNTIFRICPVFRDEYLYGGNYKDARGLIYEGGSSLAAVTDTWVSYVQNNSTYQQTFDRDVKSLEISQRVAQAQETLNYQTSHANAQTNIEATQHKAILTMGVGLLSAGAGIAAGNPMAIMGGIGAIAGGIGSQIGLDAQKEIAERNLQTSKRSQALNDSQRAESLSHKQDLFDLNIQAIQAAPGTITSTGDYSGAIYSTKCYMEFYDCTDEEKAWIEDYIRLHGMKIGRFGQIGQFVQGPMSYLEGTLVFADSLTPVVTNQLNAELNAGIYVQEDLFNEQ